MGDHLTRMVRLAVALMLICSCRPAEVPSDDAGSDCCDQPFVDAGELDDAGAELADAGDEPDAGVRDAGTHDAGMARLPVTIRRGYPMQAFDSSCLRLKDTGTWTTYAANLAHIGSAAPMATVLADLNHDAPMLGAQHPAATGYRTGFKWATEELTTTGWTPQALTVGTANGRTLAIASWHFEPAPGSTAPDRGTRVSIVDVTSLTGASVPYRNVLLVEPTSASNFVAVNNHAGGLAVFGDLLYEADTAKGVRVFDLRLMRRVSTAASCNDVIGQVGGVACAYGYEYVLPQVGGFYSQGPSSCKPKFSYLGSDGRGGPSLLSGEYCKAGDTEAPCDVSPSTGLAGRLYRWPVAADGRLATTAGSVAASGSWLINEPNTQGVAAVRSGGAAPDEFWVSSTVSRGMMARVSAHRNAREFLSADDQVAHSPEGMHADADGVRLWVITEGLSGVTDPATGGRVVYVVDQASVD